MKYLRCTAWVPEQGSRQAASALIQPGNVVTVVARQHWNVWNTVKWLSHELVIHTLSVSRLKPVLGSGNSSGIWNVTHWVRMFLIPKVSWFWLPTKACSDTSTFCDNATEFKTTWNQGFAFKRLKRLTAQTVHSDRFAFLKHAQQTGESNLGLRSTLWWKLPMLRPQTKTLV